MIKIDKIINKLIHLRKYSNILFYFGGYLVSIYCSSNKCQH